MLTPQEAESHVFPKASFGGYNMLQVDTFLDSLIEDYRTLYQENTSLKNKMKVLVDKVEEYQAVSAAEARSQAVRGQLEQEEQKVRAQLEAVRQDLANEQARLEAARAATTAYIAQLKELYTKEIQYIGSLSNLTAPPVGGQGEEKAAPAQPSEDKPAGEAVVTVPPEQQEEVAQDIEASMAKIFEPEAEAPASSADLGDTRAFDQIQFGKDYEIE